MIAIQQVQLEVNNHYIKSAYGNIYISIISKHTHTLTYLTT